MLIGRLSHPRWLTTKLAGTDPGRGAAGIATVWLLSGKTEDIFLLLISKLISYAFIMGIFSFQKVEIFGAEFGFANV